MARLFSLTQLENRIRRRVDAVNETDRFPEPDVFDEINSSLASLHQLMVGARGAEYFEKLYRTNTTPVGTGTSPPALTVNGVAASLYTNFALKLLTVSASLPATFQFSTDGGSTWSSTGTIRSSVYTDVPLPGTGLRVTFPSGTYHADNQWTWSAQQWTTVSNQQTYALPDDYMELCIVYAVVNGQTVQLKRYEKPEEPVLLNIRDWYGVDRIPHYRIRGDARYPNQALIDFAPIPTGVYTMSLYYCPQADLFETTGIYAGGEGTKFHFETEHEEWLILNAAINLLIEDDLPVGKLQTKLAQVQERITKTAPVRDATMPERVIDRSDMWRPRTRIVW